MFNRKMLIAMSSALLLFVISFGPAGEAAAQTSEAEAKAKAEEQLNPFKNLLNLEQKALNEAYKPGEIRYVYINDKAYHAVPSSKLVSSRTNSTEYMTYKDYAEKYAGGSPAMSLQLPQTPEGYKFQMARVAPYLTQKEQDKMFAQVIAEGKASGQKIYVKKLIEKRTAIQLFYNTAAPEIGMTGTLAITAEPADPKDKTVESVKAPSEKLEVASQVLIYTPINKLDKSVAWMNPKTRVHYVIQDNRGIMSKEAMITLAGQIIEASK
jgi:hypothetical protein